MRVLPVGCLLAACAPVVGVIEPDGQAGTVPDPDQPSCDGMPAEVLRGVPVTRFYTGQLAYPDTWPAEDTFLTHTSVQREWVLVENAWAPDGVRLGNLDADPENAGHGVLLGAYRSSTCGMTVDAVRAWRLDDAEGTTWVEMTVTDSSGGCDEVCEMEEWVGAAVGVPIADFPFAGPVDGCVRVVDACD